MWLGFLEIILLYLRNHKKLFEILQSTFKGVRNIQFFNVKSKKKINQKWDRFLYKHEIVILQFIKR